MAKQMTFGVIVGNRGFFPDHLAKTGREEILRVLAADGIRTIALTPEESKFGAVETPTEARLCGDLFRKHRDEIDGVIVTLPNFGEERGIVDALRLSTLKVPVLVQATPDRAADMKISHRRDSFCGKMSACNNMMQYGIPYSLTALHTVQPDSDEFRKDLAWFSSVCRVVRGFTNLARGRDRRASGGVQHGSLQREAAGAERHLGGYARSFGSPGPHRAAQGQRRRGADQAGGDPKVCVHEQYSRSPR